MKEEKGREIEENVEFDETNTDTEKENQIIQNNILKKKKKTSK